MLWIQVVPAFYPHNCLPLDHSHILDQSSNPVLPTRSHSIHNQKGSMYHHSRSCLYRRHRLCIRRLCSFHIPPDRSHTCNNHRSPQDNAHNRCNSTDMSHFRNVHNYQHYMSSCTSRLCRFDRLHFCMYNYTNHHSIFCSHHNRIHLIQVYRLHHDRTCR